MIIRTARTTDVVFFVDCVTREGWLSETENTFENFLAHDPAGCFIAEDDGRAVGLCMATSYGQSGFMGELIVVPEQRGRGLGTSLMQHAIAYLHGRGCRSVYLDGDLPAVPIYERLGFRTTTRSLRFLGKIDRPGAEEVHRLTADELLFLIESDRDAFGADRSFFLKRRAKLSPDLCFVQTVRGKPCGFILGQPGCGVVTVGPWLLTDASVDPLKLLRTLAGSCGDSRLRLGVLETNQTATALMRSLTSFEETEPCLRMVLGPDSGLGVSERLLAIGAPAKG